MNCFHEPSVLSLCLGREVSALVHLPNCRTRKPQSPCRAMRSVTAERGLPVGIFKQCGDMRLPCYLFHKNFLQIFLESCWAIFQYSQRWLVFSRTWKLVGAQDKELAELAERALRQRKLIESLRLSSLMRLKRIFKIGLTKYNKVCQK